MDRAVSSPRRLPCCSSRFSSGAATRSGRARCFSTRQDKVLVLNIQDPVEGCLLYKPYLDYLCSALLTWAPEVAALHLEEDLAFNTAVKAKQKAKVYNWLFESERLRRVRLTYFDAGQSCQAFNALLYPDYSYELPMLGIDLLSFGSNKILCVVDFIPLCSDDLYLQKYVHPLATIRRSFAASCSQMSDRFFDKDLFASKEMVFFRSDMGASEPALEMPNGGFYKVYIQYVDAHLRALHTSHSRPNRDSRSLVAERQQAYDRYLAERDPAFKVFSSYFGKQWTQRFCEDFLCPGERIGK